jgi:hypothetical protein
MAQSKFNIAAEVKKHEMDGMKYGFIKLPIPSKPSKTMDEILKIELDHFE